MSILNAMEKRRYLYHGRILNLALESEHFEIIEHKDAVAVLAAKEGKVLFVRQYRPAVGTETLEIPAGLIEEGERPEEAAARELAEETGLGGRFTQLSQFYLSPGFSNEKLHLFQVNKLHQAFGVPDNDEDLQLEWLEPGNVLHLASQDRLQTSAPTVAALFHLPGVSS